MNHKIEEQVETQFEEKATFQLNINTIDLLDYSLIDLRRMGNRQDRNRLNKSVIADTAINIVCEDLRKNGMNSMLANHLLKGSLPINEKTSQQGGKFYKNIKGEKTWSFEGPEGEKGIPIDTRYGFTGVSFYVHDKDGSLARYKENCKSMLTSGEIIHDKKHHVTLEFTTMLGDRSLVPYLEGLTKVTLNLHNEPDCGHIVLPTKKTGLIAYVQTRYIEELKNSVYDCWLNDSQLQEIGLKK